MKLLLNDGFMGSKKQLLYGIKRAGRGRGGDGRAAGAAEVAAGVGRGARGGGGGGAVAGGRVGGNPWPGNNK